MRIVIRLCFVIAAVAALCGCGADNIAKKGDQFYAIGEYFDAAAEYKKAYAQTKTADRAKRGERAWKMAECYRKIGYCAKAVGGYQNAIRYKYENPNAMLYLAQMQHKMGNYKDAIKSYRACLEADSTDTLAYNGLLGCEQAPGWKAAGSLYSIKKEPVLTSRRSDYSPALTGDDWDQVYFSTTRNQAKGSELSGVTGARMADIFFSKKDDKGKWGQPEPAEGEVNTEYEEGACCFTPDGKTMYFTRCTHDPEYPRYAQIMYSNRSDAAWSKPQEFYISKDTLTTFAHPAVSGDGKWLYFSSNMPGGHGGYDIWRIGLDEHGLSAPENLGNSINTPGNEMFPSCRFNGELYFSSDGLPGMGGLDLFMAKQDTLGTWTVKNLRSPMNSAGDDFGMTFEGVHNRGLFSTNRGNGRGWDEIMSFVCPEIVQSIKGWVYEKDGYELPEGLVYMVGNDGTNLRLTLRSDGSFEQVIKPGVDYVLLGTCKGYLNHKEEIRVDTSSVSRQHVLQFPLANITAPVLIRNVFYAFDSAELTENSTQALDSLVTLLNENPNVTIELSAHCDYRGPEEYNLKLSQRRAESVVRYLIEHGIDDKRLSPVGYGKTRPKVITRKLAEQHSFLNEGDTLSVEFIQALPEPEQQEICNALNRRTEFRVLRTTYGLFDKKEP
ncbi:MAG: OmpA family protein [Bacteroidaceae bacterium]|nr:OmpA family protein [Bacteroidaceae bacterium]